MVEETVLVSVRATPASAVDLSLRTADLPVLVTQAGPAAAFVWMSISRRDPQPAYPRCLRLRESGPAVPGLVHC